MKTKALCRLAAHLREIRTLVQSQLNLVHNAFRSSAKEIASEQSPKIWKYLLVSQYGPNLCLEISRQADGSWQSVERHPSEDEVAAGLRFLASVDRPLAIEEKRNLIGSDSTLRQALKNLQESGIRLGTAFFENPQEDAVSQLPKHELVQPCPYFNFGTKWDKINNYFRGAK